MILPRKLDLVARQYGYGYNSCSYYGNCTSGWNRWGRWVLAGVLVFVVLVAIFLMVCLRSRRRNRRGRGKVTSTPMAYQAPQTYSAPAYNAQTYGQQAPYVEQQTYGQSYAPPTGAPPQYGAGDYNSGYGNNREVELPANTYHAK